MSDIIQLLPDSVANQIAAGEVIQRPASMLKELVENAIDAGSTDIKIIVKDAGRTLVQVIDNGCGMSATDARLSFERHATSKIKNVNDLFAIRTMGFRGEALASIAAVAQTELKTKKHGDELGSHLVLSGSEVQKQEVINCPTGSNFIVRDLFFNVPARRRFLKKDSTELRHIITEFQHVVLANPDISFSLEHNNMPMFQLPVSNLRQRIINMTGKTMNNQLVPVETNTTLVNIHGFIGKPEAARKSSGDQFLFVNQRYMRHPYMHKAITEAYSNLILPNTIPAYFLYFEVDPKIIDINIHPTKTEIKFEDERAIWHILHATIKESLGKHNMIPTIDFDMVDKMDIPVRNKNNDPDNPSVKVNPHFNPFDTPTPDPSRFGGSSLNLPVGGKGRSNASTPKGWEQLYDDFESEKGSMPFEAETVTQIVTTSNWDTPAQAHQQTLEPQYDNTGVKPGASCFQFKNKYILTAGKSGLMMIDQKRAHERILFERLMRYITKQQSMSQQSLFPEQLEFNAEDAIVVRELIADLKMFGLDMKESKTNIFEVRGMPVNMEKMNPKLLLDQIIDDYKSGEVDLEADLKERIARLMAKQSSIKSGQALRIEEMDELIGQLFTCEVPNYSPDGKPIISILSNQEMENRFK